MPSEQLLTIVTLSAKSTPGKASVKMSTWANNLAAGKCGRCGQNPPEKGKSRCKPCAGAVNKAHQAWARKNPNKAQANKNAFWKSRKGKLFVKKRAAITLLKKLTQ